MEFKENLKYHFISIRQKIKIKVHNTKMLNNVCENINSCVHFEKQLGITF